MFFSELTQILTFQNAGSGDCGYAHAVTHEKDHVLCFTPGVGNGFLNRFGLSNSVPTAGNRGPGLFGCHDLLLALLEPGIGQRCLELLRGKTGNALIGWLHRALVVVIHASGQADH